MHDYDPEGPGEHDRHLLDEERDDQLATCPACGKAVHAYASRCHQCGHEFEEEAWQAPPRATFARAVAGLLLIAIIAWLIYSLALL